VFPLQSRSASVAGGGFETFEIQGFRSSLSSSKTFETFETFETCEA
jgi:hypothetical protein